MRTAIACENAAYREHIVSRCAPDKILFLCRCEAERGRVDDELVDYAMVERENRRGSRRRKLIETTAVHDPGH